MPVAPLRSHPLAGFAPTTAKVTLRASRPNEYWQIDVTVLKLLDGTKTFLHAEHNAKMPHSAFTGQTPDEM